MSYSRFYGGIHSKTAEDCLWIQDGSRYICISYEYYPVTGKLNYAACVSKGTLINIDIEGVDRTVMCRYKMRPVSLFIKPELSYEEMIKRIRWEMCHGVGCVGVRKRPMREDDSCSLSSVEMINDSDDLSSNVKIGRIHELQYDNKNVKCLKYSYIVKERYCDSPYTIRTIYIALKGSSLCSDGIYGACVSHIGSMSMEEYEDPKLDDDGHYDTAIMRMEKCPVYIKIPIEFNEQLTFEEGQHCEDVMYIVLDKILEKVNGHMIIKGSRLSNYLQ